MAKALFSATIIIAICAWSCQAIAQEQTDLPDFTVPLPGQPAAFPTGVTATVDSLDTDVGSTVPAGSAFLKEYTSNVGTRGARDISVYRDAAPAVVLVVTNDGFGSGSLLDNRTILTSLHVVKGYRQVNVIFNADSDEAGHAFQSEAGHLFRSEAGRGSDLMSATLRRAAAGRWVDVLLWLLAHAAG